MTILALDLGYRLGWAHDGGSGVAKFDHRLPKGHATGRHEVVFWRFHHWLCDKLYEVKPERVVIETTGDHGSRLTQGGMRGIALLVCKLRGVPLEEVYANTWQSWAKKRGWVKSDLEDARYLRLYWLDKAERIKTAPETPLFGRDVRRARKAA